MLSTTDAIVLSLQPHSDKAHILHAYTRTGGRVNYMVYGLGRKNAFGIYTPLSVVQITASYPSSGMPVIREASLSPSIFHLSPSSADPYKRTIALFLSEVLFHVLRHPMQDEPMFDFLVDSIQELDAFPFTDGQGMNLANFHLNFLVNFAAKLGFAMEQTPLLPQTRADRQAQLRSLCDYFEEHVETWQTPKSLDILMEVFD